jgi:hypothetical protein
MGPPAVNMFKLLCSVMDTFVNVWESRCVVCVYYAAELSHSRGDMFASERMYTQDYGSCLFAYNPHPPTSSNPTPPTAFNSYLNNNCSINIVTLVLLWNRL